MGYIPSCLGLNLVPLRPARSAWGRLQKEGYRPSLLALGRQQDMTLAGHGLAPGRQSALT